VAEPLAHALTVLGRETPVDYLQRGLAGICSALGISCEFTRSSRLAIAPEFHGQDRILAIVDAVGARHYVNSPGGEGLYERQEFARRGIGLNILNPYLGPTWSILHRLQSEPAARLKSEIERQV